MRGLPVPNPRPVHPPLNHLPGLQEGALEKGHVVLLVVPEGPGLGIELNEAALSKYPFRDKVLETPIVIDGSVADR